MCLGIPGRVVEIIDEERELAKVEVAGVRRVVSIALLTGDERPAVGDYVLIHVGFALSRIDEAEAQATLRLLEGQAEAYRDEVDQLLGSDIR